MIFMSVLKIGAIMFLLFVYFDFKRFCRHLQVDGIRGVEDSTVNWKRDGF